VLRHEFSYAPHKAAPAQAAANACADDVLGISGLGWQESKARRVPGEKLHTDKNPKPFDQIRSRTINSEFFPCIVV
jgi:hypothetical protein